MTDYLAAALTQIVTDAGQADLGEIKAQLEDVYTGKPVTDAEIKRELDMLTRAAVLSDYFDEDGKLWWLGGDD